MERFCPKKHVSLAYARNFENQYQVTKKLGLEGENFRELTGLYLADQTLMEEGRRLNREAKSPGRQLWERILPRRIYNCIYELSIKELAESRETREFVTNNIDSIERKLPTDDEGYSKSLRAIVPTLFAKGLITCDRYRLSTTKENSARIAMYRLQ